MSVRVDRIFVFSTPFHVEAMISVYGIGVLAAENTLIIKFDVVKKLPFIPSHCIEIISELVDVRKSEYYKVNKVKGIARLISQKLSNFVFFTLQDVVLGTDRSIFCQLLCQLARKKSTDVQFVLIDEGTGFYTKRGFTDLVYRQVYPLLTSLIYGVKVEYVKPIGTSSFTDIIYLRYADKLAYKSGDIRYHTFQMNWGVYDMETNSDRNLLLFTLPNDLDSIKDLQKSRFLANLIELLEEFDFTLWIKPHPREDVNYLENFVSPRVKIIEHHIPGDIIPFHKFDFIVSFKSSVVMTILQTDYEAKRVITISPIESKFDQIFVGTRVFPFEKSIIENIRSVMNEYDFISRK